MTDNGIYVRTFAIIMVMLFIGLVQPIQIAVLSGTSMAPMMTDGDIFVYSPHITEFEEGDVIVFEHPDKDIVVTHRVVAVEDGYYITQGDNNTHPDPPLPKDSDRILGGMVVHVNTDVGSDMDILFPT